MCSCLQPPRWCSNVRQFMMSPQRWNDGELLSTPPGEVNRRSCELIDARWIPMSLIADRLSTYTGDGEDYWVFPQLLRVRHVINQYAVTRIIVTVKLMWTPIVPSLWLQRIWLVTRSRLQSCLKTEVKSEKGVSLTRLFMLTYWSSFYKWLIFCVSLDDSIQWKHIIGISTVQSYIVLCTLTCCHIDAVADVSAYF